MLENLYVGKNDGKPADMLTYLNGSSLSSKLHSCPRSVFFPEYDVQSILTLRV